MTASVTVNPSSCHLALLAFGRASVAYSTFSPGVGRAHRGFSLHTGDAVSLHTGDAVKGALRTAPRSCWKVALRLAGHIGAMALLNITLPPRYPVMRRTLA